jgi:hypothetical protein
LARGREGEGLGAGLTAASAKLIAFRSIHPLILSKVASRFPRLPPSYAGGAARGLGLVGEREMEMEKGRGSGD